MSSKLPKNIADAIEAGKQKNDERLSAENAKRAENYQKEEDNKLAHKKWCDQWALEELPKIIKKESASGIFWHYVSEEQALACEKIGLETSRVWHCSARDIDGGPGNYEGWEYKVHWD